MEIPKVLFEEPLVYQGGSDIFLGPCDPIELTSEEWGLESHLFGMRPERIAASCPTSLLIVRAHEEQCMPPIRSRRVSGIGESPPGGRGREREDGPRRVIPRGLG